VAFEDACRINGRMRDYEAILFELLQIYCQIIIRLRWPTSHRETESARKNGRNQHRPPRMHLRPTSHKSPSSLEGNVENSVLSLGDTIKGGTL
jgi:hypothetical protein